MMVDCFKQCSFELVVDVKYVVVVIGELVWLIGVDMCEWCYEVGGFVVVDVVVNWNKVEIINSCYDVRIGFLFC